MNKLLTFFAAPVTAFFYKPVYQEAAKSRASRGVLYSLYLAGLSVVLIMMVLSAKVMPLANAFAGWVETNLPVMIWTPGGLSLENGQTTATLEHPEYGTIALFDMTKTTASEADMGDAYLLVTSQKAYIKKAPGQIEVRDLTGAGMRSGQQMPPRVRIDGAIVAKLYQNLKNVMKFVLPFLVLIFSFAGFLVVNLFYSLAGLLFNKIRVEKLAYGAIFNLACFATSAAFTLNWLRVFITMPAFLPPFVLNLLVTLFYLYFSFKVTDRKPETV